MIAAPGTHRLGGRHVKLTVRTLFILIAVILFAISALGVDVRGIGLVPAGLAFFAGSFIAPDSPVGKRL